MTLKNRIEKLEKRQPRPPLTWDDIPQIDADGVQSLIDTDPNFAAAWSEFIAMQKPSQILARADCLIASGAQPTADQARAIQSLRMVIHEQP